MVLIPWRFYEELSSFTEEMDQLFDRFFGREFFTPVREKFAFPPLYFTETPDEIIITLELPTFSPHELEVTFKDELLVIKGEKTKRKEDYPAPPETISFKRSIRFAEKIKEDTIQAKFKEGKLTITVEKIKPKTLSYRVPIE